MASNTVKKAISFHKDLLERWDRYSEGKHITLSSTVNEVLDEFLKNKGL